MIRRGYRVSEVFHSIQGEGSTIGKNSVFVRFIGCNMRCPWCDSKFTWLDYNSQEINFVEDDLIFKIKSYNTKNVVFTGGEPLFEKNLPFIVKRLLNEENMSVEIETNGSIEFSTPDWIDLYKNDNLLFNISPKSKNSGADYNMFYLNRKSIELIKNNFNHIFKFVIVGESDILDVENTFIKDFNITNKNSIYLMVEGFDRIKQVNSSNYMIPKIIERGYNVGVRAHVLIWDTKKKV